VAPVFCINERRKLVHNKMKKKTWLGFECDFVILSILPPGAPRAVTIEGIINARVGIVLVFPVPLVCVFDEIFEQPELLE